MRSLTLPSLAAATLLACAVAQAAVLADYAYLPGGMVIQLVQGEAFTFAVMGKHTSDFNRRAGYFIYRTPNDRLEWKRVARSDEALKTFGTPPIRFSGILGKRMFFNLDRSAAHFTSDGGETWRPLAGRTFQSNLILLGSRAYAVFKDTLHASDDSGSTWIPGTRLASGQLLTAANFLYAIAGDRVRRSADSGRTWMELTNGLPSHTVGVPGLARAEQLLEFGGEVVCVTSLGAYVMAPGGTSWRPMGSGHDDVRRALVADGRLFGLLNTRFWEYRAATNAWGEYAPWAFGKPMHVVPFQIGGIVLHSGKWLVGRGDGVVAFDPSTEQMEWADRGIHLHAASTFWLSGRNVVAPYRNRLYAIAPGAEPAAVRDFPAASPGAVSGAVVTLDRSANALWLLEGGDRLVRLDLSGPSPVRLDSITVEQGIYACRGDTIFSLTPAKRDSFDVMPDSVRVALSTDAGKTFMRFASKLPVRDFGESYQYGFTSAFVHADTLWLWTRLADVHRFSLAGGEHAFFKTDLPVSSSFGGTSFLEALMTPAGLLVASSDMFMLSGDGGSTWTLANKGLPKPPMVIKPIQRRDAHLYYSAGGILYHSAAGTIEWGSLDMAALDTGTALITGGIAGREGLLLFKEIEGMTLVSWPALALQDRFLGPPLRGFPALRLQGGTLLYESRGLRYDMRGRRSPATIQPPGDPP